MTIRYQIKTKIEETKNENKVKKYDGRWIESI